MRRRRWMAAAMARQEYALDPGKAPEQKLI
jgi:hypothetical protein